MNNEYQINKLLKAGRIRDVNNFDDYFEFTPTNLVFYLFRRRLLG